MKAVAHLETFRLILRPPRGSDAEAIFTRYASDRDVLRFVGWPAHGSVEETYRFIAFSDLEWARWPAGPYLVLSRADGQLLGGTGLAFEAPDRAATGYVLARDAWGQGYATEALRAMVDVARAVGVRTLHALCHPEHAASWRVLEKCEFVRERTLPRHAEFPNLAPGELSDVLLYVRQLPSSPARDGRRRRT